MKLKPVRPKDVKNFVQSFKRPQTWFKLFQQLYPLGSGGLRTDVTTPQRDLSGDFTVPYDYQGQSQQTFPWETFRDLGLGGLPQGAEPARPGEKHGELPKQDPRFGRGWPPYENPAPTIPIEFPRPDDLVEHVPPVHPVEESDEAEDEGELKERKTPRRRPPEYDIWSCEGQEYYLGIPCPEHGKKISIQTKASNELRSRKKSRQSRIRNNARKKSRFQQANYSRYNFSGF